MGKADRNRSAKQAACTFSAKASKYEYDATEGLGQHFIQQVVYSILRYEGIPARELDALSEDQLRLQLQQTTKGRFKESNLFHHLSNDQGVFELLSRVKLTGHAYCRRQYELVGSANAARHKHRSIIPSPDAATTTQAPTVIQTPSVTTVINNNPTSVVARPSSSVTTTPRVPSHQGPQSTASGTSTTATGTSNTVDDSQQQDIQAGASILFDVHFGNDQSLEPQQGLEEERFKENEKADATATEKVSGVTTTTTSSAKESTNGDDVNASSAPAVVAAPAGQVGKKGRKPLPQSVPNATGAKRQPVRVLQEDEDKPDQQPQPTVDDVGLHTPAKTPSRSRTPAARLASNMKTQARMAHVDRMIDLFRESYAAGCPEPQQPVNVEMPSDIVQVTRAMWDELVRTKYDLMARLEALEERVLAKQGP